MRRTLTQHALGFAGALLLTSALSFGALAEGPQIVSGPSPDPDCFKPWGADTKFFQWEKKPGPYRIALANGFVGNTWRIQMIKTAKAYAEQADVKAQIKEFKVVSTGEDLPAQIAAVDNFINAGFDAVIVNALNPAAFEPVVKRANKAGVVLISFDNVIESKDAVMVNVDQVEIGRLEGEYLVKNIPNDSAKIIEVRGPAGNSVDRDRHDGFRDAVKTAGKTYDIVEVVGKWDDGTAQKVVADALAVHKKVDGIYVQGGSTGAVRALLDAGHAMVPVAGETENGFRKLCGEYAEKGLHCASSGTGPAQVAVAIKAALSALQGNAVPQSVSLPVSYVEYPNIKAGEDYYPDLGDNFFVGNSFAACKVGFTATEIMGQSESNN